MRLEERPSILILALLPSVYLALYFYFIYSYGPFFSSRIDPEYPYLLNGMNSAQLLFGQIGHVHHPGTPFQILTGLFIRIIHLFLGKGELTIDVLSRPDFYLHGCSHLLAIGLFAILIWLGRLGYLVKQYLGMSFIQLSPFLSSVVFLVVLTRYTPDRLVICLVLILAGFILLRLTGSWDERRFALASGVIGGMALCTKVSCAPLLLIPFLLSGKYRWWFSGVTVMAFFIFLLPVFSRIDDFFSFTEKLATHDGLYGGGDERFADPTKIMTNLQRIVERNVGFILLWSITLISLILTWARKRQINLFFIGYLFAAALLVLLVSKHFKNYYLTPILTLSGLVLTCWIKSRAQDTMRKITIPGVITFAVFLIGSAQNKFWRDQWDGSDDRDLVAEQVEVYREFDRDSVYLLIDPSWQATPFPENGLSFGVSYIRHHNRFLPLIRTLFPYVLTYEGQGNPLKKLRVDPVDVGEVFSSRKPIIFYNRNRGRTSKILEDFKQSAEDLGFELNVDTVSSFGEVHIMKFQFQY